MQIKPGGKFARNHNFAGRIQQGVQDGSINGSELRGIRGARAAVASKAQEFRSNDGQLDASERAQLRADAANVGRQIHEARHN